MRLTTNRKYLLH